MKMQDQQNVLQRNTEDCISCGLWGGGGGGGAAGRGGSEAGCHVHE